MKPFNKNRHVRSVTDVIFLVMLLICFSMFFILILVHVRVGIYWQYTIIFHVVLRVIFAVGTVEIVRGFQ